MMSAVDRLPADSPDRRPDGATTWWPYIALIVAASVARILLFPLVSDDVQNFVIGWYQHLSRDGVDALTGEYANYNVAYLYALYVPARVLAIADPVLGIKVLSTSFDVLLAIAGAFVVVSATGRATFVDWIRPASVIYALPTVVMNSAWWGQCDAGYGAFAIFAVAAAIHRRAALSYAALGVSLAFKLQACFLLPAIGALSLFGWMPLWPWVVAPLVYLMSLMPAWGLGRPLLDLLTIYARQGETFRLLSASAPNPWTVVPEKLVSPAQYTAAVQAGLAVACGVGVAFLFRVRSALERSTSTVIVQISFASVFLFPFVLPKMHDRYFFLADVLSVLLALIDRRWIGVALGVQVGSATAYMPFLLGFWQPLMLGLVTNGLVALGLLLWLFPFLERLPWCSAAADRIRGFRI
jgi:Gpi18-like mannosyltransferase